MSYLNALIMALALLLPLVAEAAPAQASGPPTVIASAQADFDGDGRSETLEVVLLQGRRFQDAEPWCGSGDKWEGAFVIRVRRGEALLDQRAWDELLYPHGNSGEPAFFWAPLTLVSADYNGDGRPDFNLGAYGSCNANLYRLFTLTPQGRLAELPVGNGRTLAVSGAGHNNSTPLIRAELGVLSHTYYDNARGREITTRYRWQEGRFVRQDGQK